MTMYQAINYMASSGFSKKQITDIIQAIIGETLYIQGKESRHYATRQMDDYYRIKEREEQENESI